MNLLFDFTENMQLCVHDGFSVHHSSLDSIEQNLRLVTRTSLTRPSLRSRAHGAGSRNPCCSGRFLALVKFSRTYKLVCTIRIQNRGRVNTSLN